MPDALVSSCSQAIIPRTCFSRPEVSKTPSQYLRTQQNITSFFSSSEALGRQEEERGRRSRPSTALNSPSRLFYLHYHHHHDCVGSTNQETSACPRHDRGRISEPLVSYSYSHLAILVGDFGVLLVRHDINNSSNNNTNDH